MHEQEKQRLEQQLNVETFTELMFHKIDPKNMGHDGKCFVNKTVQLVFEAYLEGLTPNPARVLGQQLYAEIKATSKYASQIGWMQSGKDYPFPVRFEADPSGYIVKGGVGGCYRMEDVDLLFKNGESYHRIN
ncbi:hypothetical protein ALO83_101698 [Pseudomonas cannabina pv. alisalensis]|uniref:Uncharacterized protein n=2 Tax=Pseudomonas cannabina TaxID=86840 RepID=A0A3M3Q2Y2_PSECA|nr:hypothetical protein [Pseudomonas cannabina]KPW22034.1 hypothetical protein ALO83_101698 [Pseudomonas cannabina pv. alisalensis]MBM0141715.1 hypothetical protein [Pseudomonas cannabina pv. alisalensis]RMN76594.1 hypothetical protein ALQ52_102081 [Pseudomonas cannabina pv. alisalensis]RMN78478.1 hypothetical protein ALQ53_101641 [Pseudomonas cannabina]RMO05084.1 hypothetical protein ALQ51_00283 [Pseudomonas cannabina]